MLAASRTRPPAQPDLVRCDNVPRVLLFPIPTMIVMFVLGRGRSSAICVSMPVSGAGWCEVSEMLPRAGMVRVCVLISRPDYAPCSVRLPWKRWWRRSIRASGTAPRPCHTFSRPKLMPAVGEVAAVGAASSPRGETITGSRSRPGPARDNSNSTGGISGRARRNRANPRVRRSRGRKAIARKVSRPRTSGKAALKGRRKGPRRRAATGRAMDRTIRLRPTP